MGSERKKKEKAEQKNMNSRKKDKKIWKKL